MLFLFFCISFSLDDESRFVNFSFVLQSFLTQLCFSIFTGCSGVSHKAPRGYYSSKNPSTLKHSKRPLQVFSLLLKKKNPNKPNF